MSNVHHPRHYNAGKFEVIDVIHDWKLGFNLGNTVKYIARADHKGNDIEDLEKGLWYLSDEIAWRKKEREGTYTKVPLPEQEMLPFEIPGRAPYLAENIYSTPDDVRKVPCSSAHPERRDVYCDEEMKRVLSWVALSEETGWMPSSEGQLMIVEALADMGLVTVSGERGERVAIITEAGSAEASLQC